MNNRLERLKKIMRSGNFTCVIETTNELLTSVQRGVKPLLEFLDSGKNFKGAFASDKVIGKAAAFIYAKFGVDGIYTDVISEPALEVLTAHSVNVEYAELVKVIRNRSGDGFCPMESAVLEINGVDEAIATMKIRLAELSK